MITLLSARGANIPCVRMAISETMPRANGARLFCFAMPRNPARHCLAGKEIAMAYINVKAQDRGAILPDAESAVLQVTALQKWSKHWNFGGAGFGHTMDTRRKIDAAVKRKDTSAFKASKRRGYWRVELA